jgi:hypothetical protein
VRRAIPTAAALGAAVLLAACGTPSADLFVVERGGTLPGSRLTLLVKDDRAVQCDDTERTISEDQLLEARDLARDLQPLMDRSVRQGAGRESLLAFRVTGSEGVVQFFDSSPGLRPEFARVVKLTRDIAKGACGLPR